jgi:hypothetical protein
VASAHQTLREVDAKTEEALRNTTGNLTRLQSEI